MKAHWTYRMLLPVFIIVALCYSTDIYAQDSLTIQFLPSQTLSSHFGSTEYILTRDRDTTIRTVSGDDIEFQRFSIDYALLINEDISTHKGEYQGRQVLYLSKSLEDNMVYYDKSNDGKIDIDDRITPNLEGTYEIEMTFRHLFNAEYDITDVFIVKRAIPHSDGLYLYVDNPLVAILGRDTIAVLKYSIHAGTRVNKSYYHYKEPFLLDGTMYQLSSLDYVSNIGTLQSATIGQITIGVRKDQYFDIMEVQSALLTHDINLDSIEQEIILFHFWGPWCQPCIDDLAKSQDLLEGIPTSKVAIINVCLLQDDSERSHISYQKEYYSSLINITESFNNHSLTKALSNSIYPGYILINTKGKILFNGNTSKYSFAEYLSDRSSR